MSTRDLIDAIASGDSVAIEQTFNQEMSARIADRLDNMRIEVAKNMFNEASCNRKSMSEMEDEEDKDEMDEELHGNQHKIDANKNGKIDAHDFKLLKSKKKVEEDYSLEDFTIEEVEAFMQTEEYSQLNEEEKQALGNYVQSLTK